MNLKDWKVGEVYYATFNFLYQKSPYDWAWKCIAYSKNGGPVFERISPPNNITFISTLEEFHGEKLYTKEEVDQCWESEKNSVTQKFKDPQGIIRFMVEKLEKLEKNDEYGNTFTTLEAELLKKRLKEEFGFDIDLGRMDND